MLTQEQQNALGTQLNALVSRLTTKNTDMKGRRVVGAGDAVDNQDYTTLNDLTTATSAVTLIIAGFIKKLAGAFLVQGANTIFNKGPVIVGPIGVLYVSDGPTRCSWTAGVGNPENVVFATIGSLYSRTDGGVGTSLYVKESDSGGNTGWAAK